MHQYKTNWQLKKVITRRHHYYYGEHQTKIVVFRNGREIPSDLQHHLNQIAQFFKTDPTTRKWWYKSEATLMRMAIASFESHLYLYGKSLESVHKVVEPETKTECCNRRLCDICNKCIPCCNKLQAAQWVNLEYTDRCYCDTPGCHTYKCPYNRYHRLRRLRSQIKDELHDYDR